MASERSALAREQLLAALDALQRQWRLLLDRLNLSTPVDGQPGWPHDWRFAAQVLAYDDSLVRDMLWCALALLVGAAGVLWTLWRWRHPRVVPLVIAAGALILAPWPPAHLVFAPAVPTSFHQSPTAFEAAGIVQGQRLYARHCAHCHGATGRGDGPDAFRHGTWPPTLVGTLLVKRLEGELYWRVRHGWPAGDPEHRTPHAFGDQLSTTETWQVLDFLAAQAAGQNAAEGGGWPMPVRLPRTQPATPCTTTAGQFTRLVFSAADMAPLRVLPDPRLRTIRVGEAPRQTGPDTVFDCELHDPDFALAMALILGVTTQELAGHQVLTDRDGWLRARSAPGAPGWRDDDLLCKAPATMTVQATPRGQGLDALLARIEAAPLAPLRAGFVHR